MEGTSRNITHAMIGGCLTAIPLLFAATPAAAMTEQVAPNLTAAQLLLMVLAGIVGFAAALAPKHRAARGAVGAGLAAISIGCFAPVVPVPIQFENGTPADANQVNTNFDDVTQQIADHADDTSQHPSNIGDLTGGTLEGNLAVTGYISADTYQFPNGGSIVGTTGGLTINFGSSQLSMDSAGQITVSGTTVILQASGNIVGEAGAMMDLNGSLILLN